MDDLNYIYLTLEKCIVEFKLYHYVRSELDDPKLNKDDFNLKQILLEALYTSIFRAIYATLLDHKGDSMSKSSELNNILEKNDLCKQKANLKEKFIKYRNNGLCHRTSYNKIQEQAPHRNFEVNNDDLENLITFTKNVRQCIFEHIHQKSEQYMTMISYNKNQLDATFKRFFSKLGFLKTH